MKYYILLDGEDYVIGNLHSDTAPPGYIEAPEPTRVYVRAKYDTVNQVYYEGATEFEIDDAVRVLLEMLQNNLNPTKDQIFNCFFDGRGNLGNIMQERQNFYDSFYSQILEIKPTFEIPEKSPFYIPFKITLDIDSDSDHIIIPILYATSVSHAVINKTTVIESPTYNASTGRVDILVKNGDTVDITLRFV